jgi:hypothetical protein
MSLKLFSTIASALRWRYMALNIRGGTIGTEICNTFGQEVTPAFTPASADWMEIVSNHLLCHVTAIPVFLHY